MVARCETGTIRLLIEILRSGPRPDGRQREQRGLRVDAGPRRRGEKMPRSSIIIPVYGKASLTQQCLNTLLVQFGGRGDVEIVVVNDCSKDATRQVLAGYRDRIRVVNHETNKGFSTTCNDGAAVASGAYLVFLNNDTIPQPGWL